MLSKFLKSAAVVFASVGFILGPDLMANTSPVFVDDAASGLGQWTHVDGAHSFKVTPCPFSKGKVLALGNEVVAASLGRNLSDGFTLTMRVGLSSDQRFFLCALTDAQRQRGVVTFYDSGSAGADAVVGVGAYTGSPTWSSAHQNLKGVARKKLSLAVKELHKLVVTYDCDSGELTLSVDGKLVLTQEVPAGGLPELSSLYLWGNNTAFIDYIAVKEGSPVLE